MAVTGKIDRKYMAHYIDAGSLCGGLTPKYERLGKDLEEYNVELNPDTETSKNILGESTFKHNGYEVSSDADPFYADTTSDLFTALQKIVDGRLKDDNLKTKAVEVHLWTEATAGKYAKDMKEATAPICNWMKDNRKVISDLERLLGDVRKQEKQAQNRSYTNRTGVMKKLK